MGINMNDKGKDLEGDGRVLFEGTV